jgi:hypothetical protein
MATSLSKPCEFGGTLTRKAEGNTERSREIGTCNDYPKGVGLKRGRSAGEPMNNWFMI